MKWLKRILLGGLLGVLVLLGLLIFLAARNGDTPTLAQTLATTPATEQQALSSICAQAGIAPSDLRLIFGYANGLFDHALNQRAVVVRDGHVVALSLQNLKFKAPPDLTGLKALEALNLRKSGLVEWPELSMLTALSLLDLSGNALTAPGQNVLPSSLIELSLADTKIADVSVFAALKTLKQLDLSGSPVTRFDSITGLALDNLNLARSKLDLLPVLVPTEGEWALNLDDTVITEPLNFAPAWPFKSSWISHENNADARGEVSEKRIAAQGEIAQIKETHLYPLPKTMFSKASTVKLTAHLQNGRVRIWLEEPPELFASQWFVEGKIKGFGSFRRSGYVWADLAAGAQISMRGLMSASYTDRTYERPYASRRGTESPWVHYGFFVEPISTDAEGLSWQITDRL